MRIALTIFLVLMLAAGIYATIIYWDWLDAIRLSGAVIIGLIFLAVGSFGVYLDLYQGVSTDASPLEILRQFAIRLGSILGVIFGFAGGAWLVLILVRFAWPKAHLRCARWLPEWAVATIFLVAFTWFVAGVIKFLSWYTGRAAKE